MNAEEMSKALEEATEAIAAPTVRWSRANLDGGVTLYVGDAPPWKFQICATRQSRMATATHSAKLLVMKLPDPIARIAEGHALLAVEAFEAFLEVQALCRKLE